jgi:hypothetical protein
MSRHARIEVRSRVEIRAGTTDVLDVVIESIYMGEITSSKRCSLNVGDANVIAALAKCGFHKMPSVKARTLDLDRELTEIAALSEGPWPMLSHIDGDKILVGGTLNAVQFERLTEISRQLKK